MLLLFVLQMFNASAEYEQANHLPNIRLFTAARQSSKKPLYDLQGIFQNWSVASNGKLSL